MNLRLVTGAALAGVLSLGAAGVAVASTSSSPSSTSGCATASTRLALLTDLDHAATQRLSLLNQSLSAAEGKGNATRVGKIEARITRVTARQQKLEARMQKIEQRC
jgi:TolA-binding protein